MLSKQVKKRIAFNKAKRAEFGPKGVGRPGVVMTEQDFSSRTFHAHYIFGKLGAAKGPTAPVLKVSLKDFVEENIQQRQEAKRIHLQEIKDRDGI